MCHAEQKNCLPALLTYSRVLLVLLLFTRLPAPAQTANVSFHHLTVDNGLPSGLIHCMYQDVNDFMWFGTDAGLCRFDGIKCRAYQGDANDSLSLHGNHVYAVNEDGRHSLWILTEQGLNMYNRATDNFKFYPQAGLPNEPHVKWRLLNYSDSTLMIEIAETVFFSFNRYKHVFAREDPRKNLEYECRYALLNGCKCYCSFSNQARRITAYSIENNKIERKEYSFEKKGAENLFTFSSASPVKDSMLWIPTSKGLLAYNISKPSYHFYETPAKDNLSHCTFIRLGNNLWVGTDDNGFWAFDIAKRVFTQHYLHDATNPKSVAANNVLATGFVDNKGNVWMDVFAKGIDYFNPAEQKFAVYLPDIEAREKHIDNFIRAFAEDSSGNVWAGTYNGTVYRLNRQKQITATYTSASNYKHFYSIEKILVDNKKRVWVLDDGLNLFDTATGKFTRLFAGYNGTFAHDLVLTSNNRLLFLTHEYSIAELREGATGFTYSGINIDNVFNDLSVFFTDKQNRIYVNNAGGNILVYQFPVGNASLILTLPVHGYIKAFAEIDSILWIGTTSGLLRVNTQTFAYTIFTQKNGLPENTVYSVLPDNRSHLWISTNKGIGMFSMADNRVRNYTPDDGLQSNEFNTNAYLLHTDGEMWFGGLHGFNAFYPADIKDDTVPAPVQLIAMNVNDEPYYGADLSDEAALVKLPYSQRTVSFGFTGVEYNHPANIQMQYQLKGFDRDWITSVNPGFARYANLPAGTYQLQIRAANNSGIWGAKIKTLQFVVATPYYLTWWFAVLVVLAVASVLFGWYSYRIAQFKKMQMVRNRIARDLHDDIGSSVSSIRIMSDLVKDSIGKSPVRLNELVQKIGNESQQVMESIRDIVWTINPENDLLESMFIRMQEYAAQTLEASNIDYAFVTGANLNSIKLSMQQRRDLYLVFKEAVNNLAKYAQCANVSITIIRQANKLLLEVKDDGKGFDMDEIKKGNGLNNMQARAKQLKACFIIQSEINKGTLIKLELPIT